MRRNKLYYCVVLYIEHVETIAERPNSYEFEDEASWSDTSEISTFDDENDDTIIHEPSPELQSAPPKRIVCKRKEVFNPADTANETTQFVSDLQPEKLVCFISFVVTASFIFEKVLYPYLTILCIRNNLLLKLCRNS